MEIKILLSIISAVIMFIAYIPYFRDIFLLKTKPHIYTWLIWILTQGTALVGMWIGGGSWGLLSLLVGTILVGVVFLFSLKYGTKNITREDTTVLIFALIAILIWWQLNAPLISLVIVTIIDIVGYAPTFRKSYFEPWSETLSSWFLFFIADAFALLSLSQYNLMTALYISAITLANISLVIFCLVRRKAISRFKNKKFN